MDFIDWRKSSEKIKIETEQEKARKGRYQGKRYQDYVEEQIREAEERGEFTNLRGTGKPLQLDENIHAGDKALGYSLLKHNGYAPPEVELVKEIQAERERAEAKLRNALHQSKMLRDPARRAPLPPSEKRTFNALVEKTASEYEKALRSINSKILSLNIIAPPPLHQPVIQVEQQVQHFREQCPLFDF